jgi:hypothetical protein
MTPLCLAALLAAGMDPGFVPVAPAGPLLSADGIPICPRPVEPTPWADKWEARLGVPPLAIGGALPPPPGSYLTRPSYSEDYLLRGPSTPYVPQAGDIILSTDGSSFWTAMHHLAGTSHPTHSMIVFARPDGTTGILEGGPHDTLHCRTLDTLPHMWTYEAKGRVWVRRRAVPLTPEQSAKLTEFALSNDGKRFGIGRLGVQLTPFRTRGPVKTAFVGKPNGLDRASYFCSELVVEALVYAGLMDAATARPSATYPRDIFMDDSPNLYLKHHLKLAPCWDPPARWTSCPVPEGTFEQRPQSRGDRR